MHHPWSCYATIERSLKHQHLYNIITSTLHTELVSQIICEGAGQQTQNTMFMLIEHMIQLPPENSIPVIVCILLEEEPLPVIIFYEKLTTFPVAD